MIKLTKPILTAFIILDLFWAIAAFMYDWSALIKLPAWSLPFVIICPLYPLLLAIVWILIRARKNISPALFAFATIPSATYGVLSFIYYPLIVSHGGASFALLQIPWVAFYAAQGFFLLKTFPLQKLSSCIALIFFVVSLIIQIEVQEYGYLEVSRLPYITQITLLAGGTFIATMITCAGAFARPTRYA